MDVAMSSGGLTHGRSITDIVLKDGVLDRQSLGIFAVKLKYTVLHIPKHPIIERDKNSLEFHAWFIEHPPTNTVVIMSLIVE